MSQIFQGHLWASILRFSWWHPPQFNPWPEWLGENLSTRFWWFCWTCGFSNLCLSSRCSWKPNSKLFDRYRESQKTMVFHFRGKSSCLNALSSMIFRIPYSPTVFLWSSGKHQWSTLCKPPSRALPHLHCDIPFSSHAKQHGMSSVDSVWLHGAACPRDSAFCSWHTRE